MQFQVFNSKRLEIASKRKMLSKHNLTFSCHFCNSRFLEVFTFQTITPKPIALESSTCTTCTTSSLLLFQIFLFATVSWRSFECSSGSDITRPPRPRKIPEMILCRFTSSRNVEKVLQCNPLTLLPVYLNFCHTPSIFLDAATHLYEKMCPSVCPFIRRSVRWSVCAMFFKSSELWFKVIRMPWKRRAATGAHAHAHAQQ